MKKKLLRKKLSRKLKSNHRNTANYLLFKMGLQIASINSGSNGNCYYVGTDKAAVLIDAGISCRETIRRMDQLGLEIDKVKAIFISHEHSDHISGLPVLAKKYALPVYITESTQRSGRLNLDPSRLFRFQSEESVPIGDLHVLPFRKYHDAADPHSFVVSTAGTHVAVLTDIGQTCEKVIHYFKQCQAAFLESNYDRDMLMNGAYPLHLKKRISDGEGHLSNDEALNLFTQNRHPELKHLVLSHLSQNNNDPKRVEQLFAPHMGRTHLHVASRYAPSPVFDLPVLSTETISIYKPYRKPEQLSLF